MSGPRSLLIHQGQRRHHVKSPSVKRIPIILIVLCTILRLGYPQEKEKYISLVKEGTSTPSGHVIVQVPKSRKAPSGWDLNWYVSTYTPKGIRLYLGRIGDKEPLGAESRIVVKIPTGVYKFEITRSSDAYVSGREGAFDVDKGVWTWFNVEPTFVSGTKVTIDGGQVAVIELLYSNPRLHEGTRQSDERVSIYTWENFTLRTRKGSSQEVPKGSPELYPPMKYASFSDIGESHLLAAINDDPYTAMAGALLRLKNINIGSLLVALDNGSVKLTGSVARVLAHARDPRAVRPLSKILRSTSEEGRYLAAWSLGEIKDTSAAEPLMKATRDGSALVKCYAINALAKIRDKRALEALVSASSVSTRVKGQIFGLADTELPTKVIVDEKFKYVGQILPIPYYSVRDNAIYALGQLADPRAIDPLVKMLKNKDARLLAVEALGNYRDQRAVDALIGALDDDQSIRWMAVHMLGRVGDARVLERLTGLSRSDPDSMVRAAAKMVIEKIKKPKK
jgi:HEAT repeat protein